MGTTVLGIKYRKIIPKIIIKVVKVSINTSVPSLNKILKCIQYIIIVLDY